MTAVDVHAVVTGPQDAPVVVLSNSLGSTHRMWDAQIEALEAQFRVVCTGAQLPPSEAWTERAGLVRAEGSQAVAGAVVARWFTPAYLDSYPESGGFYETMVAATPAEGYAGCCEAIAKLDLRQELCAITAPTLAIAGEDDPATPPARLEEIVAAIPDTRLLRVPHSAHLANAEQPAIVTPALIKHLEQQ
jgi:3-oxoadipate enol-lactonase